MEFPVISGDASDFCLMPSGTVSNLGKKFSVSSVEAPELSQEEIFVSKFCTKSSPPVSRANSISDGPGYPLSADESPPSTRSTMTDGDNSRFRQKRAGSMEGVVSSSTDGGVALDLLVKSLHDDGEKARRHKRKHSKHASSEKSEKRRSSSKRSRKKRKNDAGETVNKEGKSKSRAAGESSPLDNNAEKEMVDDDLKSGKADKSDKERKDSRSKRISESKGLSSHSLNWLIDWLIQTIYVERAITRLIDWLDNCLSKGLIDWLIDRRKWVKCVFSLFFLSETNLFLYACVDRDQALRIRDKSREEGEREKDFDVTERQWVVRTFDCQKT